MKKEQFAVGEFYHVFNHGVENRDIVRDNHDADRFVESIIAFNRVETIDSIQALKKSEQETFGVVAENPLVNVIAYCVNPNHYHFLLEQIVEDGIQRFMQKFGTGYTNFYNTKRHRSGALFRGRYKAVHVTSNEQLLYLSAYVNLNNLVHKLGKDINKLVRSSWDEYIKGQNKICDKAVILEQFKRIEDYKVFAEESLSLSWQAKLDQKDLRALGLIC